MKHKYLASTAVVALVGFGTAAAAEITISGTARIGITTTEGAAAITGDTVYSMTAVDQSFINAIDGAILYGITYEGASAATSGAVNTMTDKNPYSTGNNAVVSSSSFVAGQVSVSSSGTTVTVKTCTKTGCGSSDQLTGTISVD